MSRRAFRIYKIFAVVLCACALFVGGLLGWLSRDLAQKPGQHPAESIVLPTQTNLPETTVPTEPTISETLSPEEQIYRDYFTFSEYRGGRYTLQDLDGNGIPEMLIRPNEEVHEIVTIVDGEPTVIISDYGLFLCEGNIVGQYGEGSGGCTVWYYEIDGSQTKPLECIVWLFHEDAWYTSTDYSGDWDTMTPITKEQKRKIVSKYLPLEPYPESGYLHFLYNDITSDPIAECANE